MAGKVNETLWHIIRVRPLTAKALRQFGDRLRNSFENGQGSVGPNDRDTIPMDAIITELLRREQEHSERSKKAQKRRKTTTAEIEG